MSLKLNSSGGGSVTLQEPSTASNVTLTLPSVTATAVGTDATQTLTNKTLSTGLVMGASAITSGTAQASTSGTNIDFTGIPSWVKRVTVMFSGVSTSGTSPVQMQVGSGSVTTSGYFSNYAAINGGLGQGNITSGIYATGGSAAAAINTGNIVLNLISGNTWIGSGLMLYTNGAGAMYMISGSSPNLSGALDRIRITTINGTDTFDAGSINILYE